MGVYQSATEPKIRKRGVNQVYSPLLAEAVGEKTLTKNLRKAYQIPRKVRPTITTSEDVTRYEFEWWEVETFN